MIVGTANAQVKVLTTATESERIIVLHKATTNNKVTPTRSNTRTLRTLNEKERAALLVQTPKKSMKTGSIAAPSAVAPIGQSQTLFSK